MRGHLSTMLCVALLALAGCTQDEESGVDREREAQERAEEARLT